MNDKEDPRNKSYYHGGDAGLLVGQYIQPPDVTGKDNMIGLKPAAKEGSSLCNERHRWCDVVCFTIR
jgi:hypothetical protein